MNSLISHFLNRRRVIATVLIMAIVVSVFFIPSLAQGGIADASQNHSPSVADPLGVDARSYASDYGVSFDEALRRLRLQDDVGDLEALLAKNEVATFAGLWIQHEPDFRIIVKLTDGRNETVRPYILGGALENLVDVGSAATSLASLKAAQLQAVAAANNLDIRVDSGINVFANRVELYAVDKTALDHALRAANIQLRAEVEVVERGHLSRPAGNIYGGLALSECTSGFSVQDSSGTKGITTAAHCPDELSYEGTALSHQSGVEGGSADVQWHTAPGFTVKNRIHVGSETAAM